MILFKVNNHVLPPLTHDVTQCVFETNVPGYCQKCQRSTMMYSVPSSSTALSCLRRTSLLLWRWVGWVLGIYHLDHAVDSNCKDSGRNPCARSISDSCWSFPSYLVRSLRREASWRKATIERRPRAAITHKFQWTIILRLQFGGRVGARAKVGGNQGHLQVPVDHHLGASARARIGASSGWDQGLPSDSRPVELRLGDWVRAGASSLEGTP